MKDLFFKIAAILILAMASVCHAQNATELTAFPLAFSDNFVDMGNGHFQQIPAASLGFSVAFANVNTTTGQVQKSIGPYWEGQLGESAQPGDSWLLWSDSGLCASVDGLAGKIGFQTSGAQQGVGVFFGFSTVLSIPQVVLPFGIKL